MFPPNFAWGAATAAYQIEGKPRGRDGKDHVMVIELKALKSMNATYIYITFEL